ncbi:MAG: PAS domain S-box protein [Polyangiaceae bacterium]|nr:PAS domain S-box protein [Polyangiaceae bacterium]
MTPTEKDWFASVVESSDDAIVTKTLEGVVVTWNRGAERLFGYLAEEMIGRPILTIFPPDRVNEEELFLGRVRRGLRVEHYETIRIRKDGTPVEISVSLSPIRDQQGGIVGVSKIARDIGERKRAQREREELLRREQAALRESQAAHRSKDEFLAMASHELRTPLNAILGWARMIETSGRAKDATKEVGIIIRNAVALTDLLNSLLDTAAMTMGRIRLNVRAIDVRNVVNAAVESIRPAALMKRVDVQLDNTSESLTVLGDPARLQQVLWNLLTNALKFTNTGGVIGIAVSRAENHACINVFDNGAGISPDALEMIFERYRQEDGSPTRKYGGLGLGLAIVRHLVELHGGKVRAESEGPGKGSRFTIELPLFEGAQPRIPAIAASNLQPPSMSGELAGRRVLVVDDDADGRELVVEILRSAGAEVVAASSGPAALETIAEQPFDVIVSDIGMPGMDGYQLLQQIQGRFPIPCAVALTAFGTDGDRERALRAGFSDHLPKPVGRDELVRAVVRAVSPHSN